MLTPREPFREPFRRLVLRAVYRRGVPWNLAELSLQKWEAGYNVADLVCEEEARGKRYGVESGCKCRPCTERRCFFFFDQVVANFGVREVTPI